jgi:hypothetical protein
LRGKKAKVGEREEGRKFRLQEWGEEEVPENRYFSRLKCSRSGHVTCDLTKTKLALNNISFVAFK